MKANKKILLPLMIVFGIGFVLAVGYYAMFSVTVNVNQPISVSGDTSQTIDCDAGSTCEGDLLTISNDADEDRVVSISYSALDVEVGYVGKLDLTKKDSEWSALGEPIELIYTILGETFEYSVDLPGYVLIYYKDEVVGLSGRLENPAPVIEIVGTIGNLPQTDDANVDDLADYSQAPDFYAHSKGAKLWAVPEEAINGDMTLDWSQRDDFYYETDLIYSFADLTELTIPANSFIEFYPMFSVDNYADEGDHTVIFTIE